MRRVYAVDPGDHPFLSYVGVNFNQDTVKNYKFYFSFFRRLSQGEIEDLLPVPDRGRFDELYHDAWHPTRRYGAIHRGTTFALKVDAGGALTHYYHLRLPAERCTLPERLSLSDADRGNYHGWCEEFSGGSVHPKSYWYCGDPQTIAHSLQLAGLTDMIDQTPFIRCLEYIESEGRDKMAWITASPHLVGELILKRGSARLAASLNKIRRECGFELFGPGSARDGTDHSLYFIQPVGPLHEGGYLFDGVQRFLTLHLKLEPL